MKEKDKDELEKLEKRKEEAYRKGIATGLVGAGSGILMYRLGKGLYKPSEEEIKDAIKNHSKIPHSGKLRPFVEEYNKNVSSKDLDKSSKVAKTAGLALAGIGLATSGYSAYRHFKNKKKKKDEDSEK